MLNYDYLSKRHTLVVGVFLCIFIPRGAKLAASWFANSKPSNFGLLIIFIGLIVCLPRLLRPLNANHQQVLTIADWVKNETLEGDIVAVVDPRIVLYSDRDCIIMWDGVLPERFDYAVSESQFPPEDENVVEIERVRGSRMLYIYKNNK